MAGESSSLDDASGEDEDEVEGEGFAGQLSRRQRAALRGLRARLAPRLDHPRFTDALVLRFLRAKQFEVEGCAEMLERHLAYRERRGLDLPTEGCWYGPGPAEAIFPELPALKRSYPHGFHKVDRLGRPVYIERLGQLDVGALLREVPPARITQYFAHESERQATFRLPACSLAKGSLVQTSVTILDLKGLGFGLLSNRQALQTMRAIIAEQGADFPEISDRTVIVNAPAAFSGIFAAIRPLLSASTLARLEVFRSGHESRLLELIAPEDLPEFLGGRCRCGDGCLARDVGPWCDPAIGGALAERPHWEVMRQFAGGGGPAGPALATPAAACGAAAEKAAAAAPAGAEGGLAGPLGGAAAPGGMAPVATPSSPSAADPDRGSGPAAAVLARSGRQNAAPHRAHAPRRPSHPADAAAVGSTVNAAAAAPTTPRGADASGAAAVGFTVSAGASTDGAAMGASAPTAPAGSVADAAPGRRRRFSDGSTAGEAAEGLPKHATGAAGSSGAPRDAAEGAPRCPAGATAEGAAEERAVGCDAAAAAEGAPRGAAVAADSAASVTARRAPEPRAEVAEGAHVASSSQSPGRAEAAALTATAAADATVVATTVAAAAVAAEAGLDDDARAEADHVGGDAHAEANHVDGAGDEAGLERDAAVEASDVGDGGAQSDLEGDFGVEAGIERGAADLESDSGAEEEDLKGVVTWLDVEGDTSIWLRERASVVAAVGWEAIAKVQAGVQGYLQEPLTLPSEARLPGSPLQGPLRLAGEDFADGGSPQSSHDLDSGRRSHLGASDCAGDAARVGPSERHHEAPGGGRTSWPPGDTSGSAEDPVECRAGAEDPVEWLVREASEALFPHVTCGARRRVR
ncbi:unnamed protein product [Prorocentrum cordatum]|uniref:CRAL-TRIO domain-containing protein n=1 Tax=Prorocentrum cordatum TaxID=2364126 RepID=A0ABN9XYN3_9DINO|nr:unnamed protein product [Polarella glacialis]